MQRAWSVLKKPKLADIYWTDRTSEVNKLFIICIWLSNLSSREIIYLLRTLVSKQQNSLRNALHFILACQWKFHNFVRFSFVQYNLMENLLTNHFKVFAR